MIENAMILGFIMGASFSAVAGCVIVLLTAVAVIRHSASRQIIVYWRNVGAVLSGISVAFLIMLGVVLCYA